MAPHTINTAVADFPSFYSRLLQLFVHGSVHLELFNLVQFNLESAIFFIKTGSYSQNIIINANTNKH